MLQLMFGFHPLWRLTCCSRVWIGSASSVGWTPKPTDALIALSNRYDPSVLLEKLCGVDE